MTLSVCLAAALCAACAGPIRPTGFLPNTAELRRLEDRDVAMSLLIDDAPTTPDVLAIHAQEWAARHRVRRAKLALWLEDLLEESCYNRALDRYPAPTIVTRERNLNSYLRTRETVYRLELAVTDIDPGWGILRYVVGFYAGAAAIQAEFRLRDVRTQRLIATFAIRRRHPGDARMGFNPLAMFARFTLRRAVPEVARDAVFGMSKLLNEGEAAYEKVEPEGGNGR